MNIHVLTPCYRSPPRDAFEWAKDHDCARVSLEVENALLPLARARLVAQFMSMPAPWALFRDDDVDLPTADLAGMLAMSRPVVLAPYMLRDRDRTDIVKNERGEVLWGGLGCALVSRHVLEDLYTLHHEELHFYEKGELRVDLFASTFATLNDEPQRQQLKDDHAFWQRVRAAGFALSTYPAHTVHAGQVLL